MMFDRVYGRLRFPRIIHRLLDCPGLLRVREVRMSSVPFINFPSFYFVNRFEHSLGVCYLSQLASETLGISTTEKLELMCACLYHDVATPPFAHVTEEILQGYFGFDHETHLRNLLIGITDDLGMERSQVFLGRSLKLPKVVQSKEGRELGLDILRIADMAIGKGKLGSLLKGDIDLDNIDNVIRSATAIGITTCSSHDAENLARSFNILDEEVALDESKLSYINKWQRVRHTLYDMIYGDIEDFSLQTMLKCAVNLLLETESEGKLLPTDWRLTDEMLIHDRIMRDGSTRKIMERIRLCDPYPCVGVFSLSGVGSYSFLTQHLSEIEQLATEYFEIECAANYTVDKRQRTLIFPLFSFGRKSQKYLNQQKKEKTLLFVFSTDKEKHAYREPDHDFLSQLQSLVPDRLNLKQMRLIVDRYPRLVEVMG